MLCLSREDFQRKPDNACFFVKSKAITKILGVHFPQDGGGGGRGGSGTSKGPTDSVEVGGGRGESLRGDRNFDNNSASFDMHVSPLIAFSH